jgi:antitoxin VapB
MVLNIRDPEVHTLARRVADATGETMTQAVKTALEERLRCLGTVAEAEKQKRMQAILDFAKEWRSREVVDPRTPEEIWGYDENGLPT